MAYDPIQGVIVSLEKLDAKLDKRLDEQDGKIDSIAVAIQRLIAVDIEIREIKASSERVWQEIRGIKKDRDTIGCHAFKEFRTAHDNELKHNIAKIEDIDKRVKAVETIPITRIETISKGFLAALGGGIFAWVVAHWKG